jgi:actin-like ATPase involved in cell morphogenesis
MAMGEDTKAAFGEQLYSRLQSKGLSKYQVDKVLALQRLDPEVSELGAKGLLGDAQLLEISKIQSAARQKQLAELAVEKGLSAHWVKELTKLIRNAERARTDQEANRYWDFFFEVKEMTEKEGPTRTILQLIKNFSVDRVVSREGRVEVVDEDNERRVVSFNKMDLELGRGLDVGTVNICAAARKVAGEVVYNIQRNAFLDVRSDAFTKKMLMKLGIDYIVQGDKGYVIGDPAFELANIFEKNTRRPMKDGMISPIEPEALLIVSLIIAQLLGHPKQVGEVCAFSVPADPIDVERNVIYHRGALETVLRKLGYTPKPMLEGHSVVFSELKEQDYTGIGISAGGGMFNVCISYKSVPALTFATSRGGDWVDNNVSAAIGMPAALVCAVKESGVDLMNPKDRVQDAICIYYRNLIQYTLETIKQKFETAQNMPTFTKPIDVVCAGGTSMIQGFIDVFKEEFEKINFPVEINVIRLARDPLKAIAHGCMAAAHEETKALQEVNIMVAPAALQRSDNVVKVERMEPGTKLRPRPAALRDAPQVVKSAPLPAKKEETSRVVRAPAATWGGGIAPAAVVKREPPPAAAPKRETSVRPAPAKPAEPPKPPPKKAPEPVLEEVTELEELKVEELPAEPGKDEGPQDLPLIS